MIPIGITAQAKHLHDTPQVMWMNKHMTGERRLFLCVLLQAIAEQDTRYIQSRYRLKQLQREAIVFVRSEQFAQIAHEADLPLELLRKLEPEQAWKALNIIRDPNSDVEAAARALSPVREETLPTCGVTGQGASVLELCSGN